MNQDILSKILGRTKSMFLYDIQTNQEILRDNISNSRLLVIGAAGSIGSAFVKQVVLYNPTVLHLVDLSENNLVELVRDLRSSKIRITDNFRTIAIGMGSLEFDMFLRSEKPYDYVINFAALKHVRSERDAFSLIRMLNTNVCYFKDLLEKLLISDPKKVFSVSSDKAVNPQSVMGASKSFMEKLLLSYSDKLPFSTTRFANVAFSDGSLLFSFHQRLAKNQPLSAPSDVKRYFISHEEAAQLCLLSCFLGENRDIFIPNINYGLDLIPLSEIALIFLKSKGYKAKIFDTEKAAKDYADTHSYSSEEWPCYFSTSDTSGEKPFEEFYKKNEKVDFGKFDNVGIIHYPEFKGNEKLFKALEELERIKKLDFWNKGDIVKAIKIIVPEFKHKEKFKNLDQKM